MSVTPWTVFPKVSVVPEATFPAVSVTRCMFGVGFWVSIKMSGVGGELWGFLTRSMGYRGLEKKEEEKRELGH